jgi:diguanylate cyclase (GGDEF)-like protein
MLDLDHFKTVNDVQGHDVGDSLLKMVAQTLIEQVRTSDIVTRYGGDEFMVIMPETSDDEGLIVVRRLREELTRGIDIQGVQVTASFGLITYTGEDAVESAADLMRQVDQAMLLSKRKGRDCIEIVHLDQESPVEVPRPFRVKQGPDTLGPSPRSAIPEAS